MSSTAIGHPTGCETSHISRVLAQRSYGNSARSLQNVRHGDNDIYKTYMTEACGTCVATQVEGPSPGVQGIAKIRMQYVLSHPLQLDM